MHESCPNITRDFDRGQVAAYHDKGDSFNDIELKTCVKARTANPPIQLVHPIPSDVSNPSSRPPFKAYMVLEGRGHYSLVQEDNARVHNIEYCHRTRADLGFGQVWHPPTSPDLNRSRTRDLSCKAELRTTFASIDVLE